MQNSTPLRLRGTAYMRFSLFIAGLLIWVSSMAANFPVTNGNNAGPGSLRQAILDANASAAVPHTITFTVSGVINITSSLPTITRQVTIDGGNAVTISGPGANNTVALFVLGTGSGGSTITNLAMRNTGLEPIRLSVALSNVTITNVVISQTGAHYLNHAILANAAVTNLIIKNVTVTQLEDKQQALYFGGNVTSSTIDGFKLSGGGGLSARGIHIQGVTNGLTIKNSIIDLDDPATTDDGDYGIVFAGAASNVTIDSSAFHDNEISAIYCGSTATTFSIKNSTFDNVDGWTGTKFVQFRSTTNGLTVDNNSFNADLINTADDGDFSLVLAGSTNQSVTITNNRFQLNDTVGIYIGDATLTNNHDNVLIKGNNFIRNGSGVNASGGIDFLARNTTSDGGAVLITENTFYESNGNAMLIHPGNTTTYVLPNFTVSKNIIYNTRSTWGTVRAQYVDKIIITQNSIYNNQGIGIELIADANCGYEGANTPQILSSAETTPGTYNVTVKLPAICGTGNCSVELFSNEAGIKGVGGQHYVVTKTGLSTGNNVLTGITGPFAEITAAPYGTWTATLKVNNNCGTSEFSNKKQIKPNGPAGISNGIALWLRADDLSVGGAEPTASGQVISGWEEFSGGGGPSSTTIIGNPLTKLSGINFNPVADMDGDGIRGIWPTAYSWITTPTTTSVAVFNPFSITPSGDRFYCLFSQAGSDYNTNTAQIEFYRTGNNINSYRGNTLLNPAITGTTGVKAFDRPGVFSSLTSATNHTSYYNGANMGSGNYSKGNFTISQWFVGTGWNTTDGWQGGAETDFAEVFTYNRVLSATELQKVQSYMALKYGIAMKQNYVLSNGTLVWDVTANAAYSKEIAALVRDNLSVLHQRQARAFQTDEVVSIALGSELAATNKDNDSVVTNDLSLLAWGNDSTAITYTQPFSAGTYSTLRMPRVWKVQKTNWADQDITIKLTGGKDNIYLLVSNDPAFGSITQEIQFKKDGTVTVPSSILTNGSYFTFGRQQRAPGGVATGLGVWAKADEGVTKSGTNAITWEDQGPSMRLWNKVNTNTLTWGNADMNYNPAIRFPGPGTPANYFTYSPQFTPAYTQGEIFSVQSSAINNVEGFPWQLGGNSGTTVLWYRYTDNNMYLHWGTNARRNFSFGTKNMALPAILNVNTAANSWTASLDGKAFSGPAAYTTSFAQTGTNNALGVAYGSYFNGPVGEVILYNRKLSATERQQVNSYMALKYGITLDQTTPANYLASDAVTTMWKAADNTGYSNNIAGVGRDDKGTLYQKQSRSINTAASGNLVAIAVGSELAVDNESNSDTVVNDKSFLVWGDNNGAVTYTTAVTGNNVTLRMPRVWKVDKTNWATRNVTIKLHSRVSNTYLLISNSDATFATIDQELPVNADSTITISSDLLPDGAYFTFAKQMVGPGFVNTGVQLWLRADDAVSANDTWYDYSGNDVNATQATVSNQPVLYKGIVNFNPSFRFDGTDDYMDFASTLSLTGTTPFTVVGLGLRESVTNWDAFLSSQTNTANGFMFGLDPSGKTEIYSNAVGPVLIGTAVNNKINAPYLVTGTRTGNNFALYSNGKTDGAVTVAQTYAAINMRLGNRLTSADLDFAGKIPEVVVYNRALATYELQRVHSYLALKYGITLDQTAATDYVATDWDGSNGTKMWTASKNGIYNKNIAGLGHDEKTGLYQKQSRSSNDSLIAMAIGSTIAADNESNGGDMDDLSFFTWADNGGATTFSLAVTGQPNATARMARVWKVDQTNWTDQDITIKVTQNGDRYLLVNTTGDPAFGAAGTTEYALNTATGSVTINTANLPDGAYFTVATKIVGPACVNSGIVTWLRADYGATVGNWSDFSGNQTSAAQATAANQPVLLNGGMNYNSAIQFDGAADYLMIPQASITGKYSTGNAARTLIGVGVSTTTTDQILFNYGSFVANQSSGLRKQNLVAVFEGNGAGNGVVAPANSYPNNKLTIISGRYVGGAGSTASLYTNSTTAAASGAMSWNTVLSTEGAQIGKYVGEVRYWNGNIGEVIAYNRNLTDPEFQRVSSYLALKYGITLNQTVATDYLASDGTTKMWTAADNTGYNNRITGIGRDDCTDLYQKQSLSADAGIVAIAIGDAVETTNALNYATIDNNNSYFVFADDNGAVQYNTNISGLLSLTTRMARTWKVDKTNWSDAGVTFKLTGGSEKVYLVVSSDATFDGTDNAYQLDAGGNVTIPTDQIPDGAYFTFAKELNGPGYVNVGVQLWMRADDNVSTVDTWNDYSGNDNNATQPTAANQPVFTTNAVNYNPAFDFDGTDDYMDFATNGTITGANPFTVVSATVRNSVGTADGIIAQQGNVTNNLLVQHSTTNKYGIAFSGTPSVLTTGTYPTANIPYISSGTRSGSLFSLYTNGSADGTGTQAGSFTSTNLRIGNRAASADCAFDGYINEVVVYNRVLNAAELRQVHSYMSLKYGITMSGDYIASDGTTTYWTAASNTGYLNNITGIGRDDNTGLYQKQSRSVNTTSNGNMVAIGLNTIEATNKLNTATFDDDLEFLVWGDNGLNGTKITEYPAALDPGGCSKITRLQREWKVQKTGNAGAVRMQMYLAGLVPSSTGASDLKLLIDDDGDFSSGVTTIMDANSYDVVTQTVVFDGINFTSGQYFTLVTDLTNQAPGGVITNLYTWYRADKGVTTATGVSLWADQSASAKDVTQATAAAQPVYNTTANLINFNPDLGFDGSADVLSNSTISHSATANGEDMFAVVLPNTLASFQDIVGLGTLANTNTATELRFNSNKLEYLTNNGSALSITNPATSNGLVQLTNGYRSNVGASGLLLNGSTVVTGTISQFPVANYLNIGARRAAAANSFFFNGQIAEVAIYNRQLTTVERQKVASYFAVKYGITLPHNYVDPAGAVVWDVTVNTGYGFNITGIGRDDCNGLHQRQSKSVNATEALVTLGNYVGIATTNAGNANNLDNATALLLGDNNANRTAWTATGAPLNRQRIARTWKVQETGNIGTVTIQVPANASAAGVKLPLEKDGVAYLLVSTSGDFVNDVTEVPMTLNGTNWEAAYDFASGQYFTFATNDDCVSAVAVLSNYGAVTSAAANKCYINNWILFKDPVDPAKYIAGIYDPAQLIDRTKITASVNVNNAFADLGKGNSTNAARLMRRMLQVDCSSCYDAIANPVPNFTVRMFYAPGEKSDAESVETNNMEAIKTANGLVDPQSFKWFKASAKTAAQVAAGLTANGIAAGGQEWVDGALATGQVDGVDYVDFAGINGFSTFGGIWVVNLMQALPVTWLDVRATSADNRVVNIKWSTAAEINNAGFAVERSEDGIHFQAVAKVGSQGNTTGTSYYAVDDQQVQAGIKYYYRIRQTDIDGRTSLSKTVTIQLKAEGFEVRLMSNPVKDKLEAEIIANKQQLLQIMLTDVSGKVISTQKMNVLAGRNLFTSDVLPYADGTYFIRIVAADGTVIMKKFIIQKG